jgi:hypothetical protein
MREGKAQVQKMIYDLKIIIIIIKLFYENLKIFSWTTKNAFGLTMIFSRTKHQKVRKHF